MKINNFSKLLISLFFFFAFIIIIPSKQVFAGWAEHYLNNPSGDSSSLEGLSSIASSSDGENLIAVSGWHPYIFTSKDGGNTWFITQGLGQEYINKFQFGNSGTYSSKKNTGTVHKIFTYPNGEKSGWEIRGWYSVASSSDGMKLAVLGHAGIGDIGMGNYKKGDAVSYLFTSIDGGENWTEQNIPGADLNKIISSSNGMRLTAIDLSGNLYVSEDAGVTWTKRIIPGTYKINNIASSSDGMNLYAVVKDPISSDGLYNTWTANVILISKDAGVTWNQSKIDNAIILNSIASSFDGTKLAVVGSCKNYNDCHIYTSKDGGNTWKAENNNFSDSSQYYSNIVSSSDGSKLVAVGSAGIYVSKDSGTTWIKQNQLNFSTAPISISSDGSKIIVSDWPFVSSKVFIYSDENPDVCLNGGTNPPSCVIKTSSSVCANGSTDYPNCTTSILISSSSSCKKISIPQSSVFCPNGSIEAVKDRNQCVISYNCVSKLISGDTTEKVVIQSSTNVLDPSDSSSNINRVLRYKSKGNDVKVLQRFLGITDDGVFGSATLAKVKAWQKANKITANGIFGSVSKSKMKEIQSRN